MTRLTTIALGILLAAAQTGCVTTQVWKNSVEGKLIEPDQQSCPPGEYTLGLMLAAFLTPTSLVYDLFLTPAFLLHQRVEF